MIFKKNLWIEWVGERSLVCEDHCEDDPLKSLAFAKREDIILTLIRLAFKFRKLSQNCNKLFHLNDVSSLVQTVWQFTSVDIDHSKQWDEPC